MRIILRAVLASAAMTSAMLTPQFCAAQSIDIVAPASHADAAKTPDSLLRQSIDPATEASPGDDAALAAALNYDPAELVLPKSKKKFVERAPAAPSNAASNGAATPSPTAPARSASTRR